MRPSRRADGDPASGESNRGLTRRALLGSTALGLGGIALGSLLYGQRGSRTVRGPELQAADNLLAPQVPHFAPRAKRVIFLHMVGAASQLDLLDYKPALQAHNGEPCPDELLVGARFAQIRGRPRLLGTPYAFARHGQSGTEVSELLPHLAQVVDHIAVVKTVHTDQINHGPAELLFHTGFFRYGRPSMGSWVVYGLGSENQNLPAYAVMMTGQMADAGSALWGNGFLPSIYQGVEFRSGSDPVLFLSNPEGIGTGDKRRMLDAIRELNQARFQSVGDPEIGTRIAQYELAFRMQTSVPELTNIASEQPAILEMYGATPGVPSFANNCLLARRLIERGVRFVELFDANWDYHIGIFESLPAKCREVDRGAAALVKDLHQRGLLDDTLVVWGGEFGRTPVSQDLDALGVKSKPGRDHHTDAFTVWLAGGGVKPGITYGTTDELGYRIVDNPVSVNDLHATILHVLGLDHEKLTYRSQGREFRLTDVAGDVVEGILA